MSDSADSAVELRPSPPDLIETFDRILAARSDVEAVLAEALGNGAKRVYLVGSGGSYLANFNAAYLLERHLADIAVHHVTSGEFVAREPAGVDEHAIVIAGSHTGSTKETIASVEFAKARGATVLGYASSAESGLAKATPHFWSYESLTTTGDAKQLFTALFAWSLLKVAGADLDFPKIEAAYAKLGEILQDIHVSADDRCRDLAATYARAPMTYVVGAGPAQAGAYNFAMCYLLEMQWLNAAFFNSAEFFHGALEIVEKNTPVYLFLGEDATRPLGERVRDFLARFTDRAIVIDSKDFELPQIDPGVRDVLAPHILFTLTGRIAAHYAVVTQHALATRRYMGKVQY